MRQNQHHIQFRTFSLVSLFPKDTCLEAVFSHPTSSPLAAISLFADYMELPVLNILYGVSGYVALYFCH